MKVLKIIGAHWGVSARLTSAHSPAERIRGGAPAALADLDVCIACGIVTAMPALGLTAWPRSRTAATGIVNLSGHGMLVLSVARQLGSGNSFTRLLCCPAQAERGRKKAPWVR